MEARKGKGKGGGERVGADSSFQLLLISAFETPNAYKTD
jgi:hypothetical protein